MTKAVETRELWKTYGSDIHAVKGANIRIEPGELMVLVGPSGCGKTTTLRMVAGLERISAGEVRVGDRVVNDVHPARRGVALVFQNFALYPHKSAFQNMAFPLESAGVGKDEIRRRVTETAEMLELTAHLDKRPGERSGGQQQRVSLGRAIVRNPDVLLLDEPLSNLDARLRVVMRTELKRIQRAVGSTAIYVTHDQVEAMTMGDRIVVMHAGEVAQIGTPQEVYLTPASLPVARTIGSPAMNLLPGRVQTGADGMTLSGTGWSVTVTGDAAAHAAQALGGADIVLGIRPEDLGLGSDAGSGETAPLLGRGPCLTAEPLGSETLYNIGLGDAPLRLMRRETHVGLPEGANAPVMLRPGARLHLFDATTGARRAGLLQNPTPAGTAVWHPYTAATRMDVPVPP